MIEVVGSELEKAVKNIHTITKLKVAFFDKERNVVFSYPEDNQKFCNVVRACPELKKECLKCDSKAMDVCMKTRKPYVYTCHMNLVEAVNPILANDEIIGYVLVGQKVEESCEEKVKKRIFEVSKKYEIDGSELLSGMEELQRTDISGMEAVMNVMLMCTSYLYRHRYIVKRGDAVPAYQIEEYLYENIGEDLSIPAICKHFHISKSKLYSISKKAFGIGFSDYVRNIRIFEGKKMLETTKKSITQISEEIGFSDVNYFIRVFRQQEGMSPNKYRKMMQKEPE